MNDMQAEEFHPMEESSKTVAIESSIVAGDIDTNGHLALGLFAGVVLVILVLIYALASAA